MSVKGRGQHDPNATPPRDPGPHRCDPVRRSNGDWYCGPCGRLLECKH